MGPSTPCARARKIAGIESKPMWCAGRRFASQAAPATAVATYLYTLSGSPSNIHHPACQAQRLGPKSRGSMNGLYDFAQLINKLIYLPVLDYQRRRHLEHQEAVAADLGEYAFFPEELHHQHLPEHSRMNSPESFE